MIGLRNHVAIFLHRIMLQAREKLAKAIEKIEAELERIEYFKGKGYVPRSSKNRQELSTI